MTAFSLFAVPKPFSGGLIDVIQCNATWSWTFLEPEPEIALLGNGAGIAEQARCLGLRHAEVAYTEYGTPLIRDVFRVGEMVSARDTLCYVNADIILMQDFNDAVELCAAAGFTQWLMVGQRWDVAVDRLLNFEGDWRGLLRNAAKSLGSAFHVDYFAYSRGLWPAWDSWPALLLGRTKWDNWLIAEAQRQGAAIIDATAATLVVHQKHGYAPDAVAAFPVNEARMVGAWGNAQFATHRICEGKVEAR